MAFCKKEPQTHKFLKVGILIHNKQTYISILTYVYPYVHRDNYYYVKMYHNKEKVYLFAKAINKLIMNEGQGKLSVIFQIT